MKIEIVNLKGNNFTNYACTQKQLEYIILLCQKHGHYSELKKFVLTGIGWENRRHLTKIMAIQFIKALKAREEIEFCTYIPTEVKPVTANFKPVQPQVSFDSVPKITLDEMEAKLKKLNDDNNPNQV